MTNEVTAVQRGQGTDYYAFGIHVAAVIPPGPHDWPRIWTAENREGRTVGYEGHEAAENRARAYAEQWYARYWREVAR